MRLIEMFAAVPGAFGMLGVLAGLKAAILGPKLTAGSYWFIGAISGMLLCCAIFLVLVSQDVDE